MSRLVFDLVALRPIVEHALSASEHAPAFGQTPPIAPALWLVKDDGIYLMSNGRPRQMAVGSSPTGDDQAACDAPRDPRGAAAHDSVVMSVRVTRANVKQLVEAMGEVTTAWETVEESITTWMEYQVRPPDDEDGREARREAREAIESEID